MFWLHVVFSRHKQSDLTWNARFYLVLTLNKDLHAVVNLLVESACSSRVDPRAHRNPFQQWCSLWLTNGGPLALTWYSCAYFFADTSQTNEVQRFLSCSQLQTQVQWRKGLVFRQWLAAWAKAIPSMLPAVRTIMIMKWPLHDTVARIFRLTLHTHMRCKGFYHAQDHCGTYPSRTSEKVRGAQINATGIVHAGSASWHER